MNKKFKQKLLLKGLGFRCFFSDDKSQLKFKIGYSHIISLDIPKSISSVVIEKSFLIFEGVDSVELGNFCRKIKNLKKIDVYKNKGFSYPNENIKLKTVKKK